MRRSHHRHNRAQAGKKASPYLQSVADKDITIWVIANGIGLLAQGRLSCLHVSFDWSREA
jgi:hypothetical protein